MIDDKGQAQSGGVNISGSVGSVGGDIVGRDKISAAELRHALRPVTEAIDSAPPDRQPEAREKVAALEREMTKGKDANDGIIAKLVDGLVELVPTAASALVSAFATPLLGAIAGPVTKFVLDKLRGG